MPNISALEALNAAVSASSQIQRNPAYDADFSSYLKTEKTLEEIYTEASQTYGVSIDLLKAMTKQESNFNPNATSRSGAQGLMDKYGGIPPFAETQNYVAKITQYLAEGVEIPNPNTLYTAESTVKGDPAVSYQDLNTLAGNILTEIFSYDDYMKHLNALLGKDKTAMALSLSVVTSSEKTEKKDEEQNLPDSYIAYETLSNSAMPESLTTKTEIV